MHYHCADGRYRTATAGETIQVHPDYVELFDRLNVLLGQEPSGTPWINQVQESAIKYALEQLEEPKPKRRPGRPRKTEE
jgi:hypothetical protein